VGYSLLILPTAEKDLKRLDLAQQTRMLSRLQWLADHAEVLVHHRLQGVPDEFTGMFRFRIGAWRALYRKFDVERVSRFIGFCTAPKPTADGEG
jgi:mRNA-degrading endonuclease RelE of RelBE toxin-antitoxin system